MQCSRGYFTAVPALAVAALAMLAPVVLQAQGRRLPEREDSVLRADCRLAAQAIETGRPSPHFDWAMESISRCDETAGEALALAWRHAPTDSVTLMILGRSSREMKDQRIYEAAVAVARDVSRSWWPRQAALRLLASYVEPRVTFNEDGLRSEGRGHSSSHTAVREGSQPLVPGAIPQILVLLADLAANDPDPLLRNAARLIHDRIRYSAVP